MAPVKDQDEVTTCHVVSKFESAGVEQLHYLGGEEYSALKYALLASWHFSIVIPAVFETTELVGSLKFVNAFSRGPKLPVSSRLVAIAITGGMTALLAVLVWPQYAFPLTWLSVLLILDPINQLWGRPSLLSQVQRGDWRLVVALGLGALICGWFWEMWNFWAFPIGLAGLASQRASARAQFGAKARLAIGIRR